MRNLSKQILLVLCLTLGMAAQKLSAAEEHKPEAGEGLNAKELIMEHVGDAYEWHITSFGDHHVSIPLPVIVAGSQSGLQVFLSSKFEHGHKSYNGFYIAESGDHKGKIVEKNGAGEEIRPWDFSITKNTMSLFVSCVLLLWIILGAASSYRKQAKTGEYKAPKGFVGFIEILIMNIQNEVIKPCIGKNYQKFSPYLLTAFFFILINNLMGLVPLAPGGANVTGNIAITLVLALFTFVLVNLYGTKEYWREIFWPDVPIWLKIPPIMPIIEFVSVFTKPFALMIRLFANILAGHSIAVGLTCLIFLTVSLGPAMNGSMTFLYIVLGVFMGLVEVLVAYIQAYVFTLLSAVFIGLAQVEPHHHPVKH